MLKLDLDAAERFTAGHPDAFWDGWTLVLFKTDRRGEHNKRGMYRNGTWGVAKRVEPDETGRYRFSVA
jgi:hypothetical protein